jgi:hypothetical protein
MIDMEHAGRNPERLDVVCPMDGTGDRRQHPRLSSALGMVLERREGWTARFTSRAVPALRAVRRIADWVPVTPLGVIVAGLSAVALRELAFRRLDLVILVACSGVLAMVVASAVLVLLGAVRVKLGARSQRSVSRTLETGRLLPTGFSLPGLFAVPLLQVRWEWETPAARIELRRRGFRLHEYAELFERGLVSTVCRRIVIQDAFGLARFAIRHLDRVQLEVLPHAGGLRQLPVLVSMAGGDEWPHPMGIEDGDRVDLRRYVPGEPARFIHWKVFGRTRKLMVRVPERALVRSRRTVAYLVGGPDDEASAAAARVAIEGGALGAEWVFGADGTEGDAKEVRGAIDRVVRSASTGDRGALALRGFVERAERTGPASLVLFCPPRPGPWLDRTVAVLRARNRRSRVVIAVDGLDPEPTRPWWWRLVARPAVRRGTPVEELESVLRALASIRVEVVLLDRPSGRRLGSLHRSEVRARKTSRGERQVSQRRVA